MKSALLLCLVAGLASATAFVVPGFAPVAPFKVPAKAKTSIHSRGLSCRMLSPSITFPGGALSAVPVVIGTFARRFTSSPALVVVTAALSVSLWFFKLRKGKTPAEKAPADPEVDPVMDFFGAALGASAALAVSAFEAGAEIVTSTAAEVLEDSQDVSEVDLAEVLEASQDLKVKLAVSQVPSKEGQTSSGKGLTTKRDSSAIAVSSLTKLPIIGEKVRQQLESPRSGSQSNSSDGETGDEGVQVLDVGDYVAKQLIAIAKNSRF